MRAVADIGSHWLDLTRFITGQDVERGLRRFRDLPAGAQEADGAARDLRRQGAPAGRVRRAARSGPRTTRASCSGSRRGARRADRLAGRGRAQEPQRVRDQRLRLGSVAWNSERVEELWIGHRDGRASCCSRTATLMLRAARLTTEGPAGMPRDSATPSKCSTSGSTGDRSRRSAAEPGLPDLRRRRLRAEAGRGDLRERQRRTWVTV